MAKQPTGPDGVWRMAIAVKAAIEGQAVEPELDKQARLRKAA